MLLDVEHRLRFEYAGFVRESQLELRVEPRTDEGQTVHSFYLAVGPPSAVARYVDWTGNAVHHFGVADYHDRIEVVARSLVDVRRDGTELAKLSRPPQPARGERLEYASFGGPVVRSEALEELARELALPDGAPLGELLGTLGHELLARFRYRPGVTDYRSTTDAVLAQREGVCQDFAHLLLALLRLRGLACRYVSGYLHVDASAEEPSQSHAWIEVWDNTDGWVAFDPTHARAPDSGYVTVARGRHYDDVPPNRGVTHGRIDERLEAEVVTRVAESRDVVGLHQEIEDIEVPVYRELPQPGERARRATPEQAEAAAAQQQ